MPAAIFDAEDQDLTPWSGDTANFSFVSSPVQAGSWALKDAGGDGTNKLYSTSGLDNYFSKGQEADFYVRFAAGGIAQIHFGLSDSSNYYRADISNDGNSLVLYEVSAGSSTFVGQDSSTTIGSGEWYRLRVIWDDGTLGGVDNDITLELYDSTNTLVGSSSNNDATHATATGVGLRASDGSGGANDIYFDSFVLPNILTATASGAGSLTGSAAPQIKMLAAASGLGSLGGSAVANVETVTVVVSAGGSGTGDGTATLSERQRKFIIGTLDGEDENDVFVGSNI